MGKTKEEEIRAFIAWPSKVRALLRKAWHGFAKALSGNAKRCEGTAMQRLSADQLGRRMAMKRHSFATISKACGEEKNGKEQRWHREAGTGKGNVPNCYGIAWQRQSTAKKSSGRAMMREALAKYCKEELWHRTALSGKGKAGL